MSPEPVDPDERVEVSLTLKPRRPLAELESRLGQPMSREEFADAYGADPTHIERVQRFARDRGLDVIETSQPRRTVRLGGRAADIASAFGVRLIQQHLPDGTGFRAPEGPVQFPPELGDIVEGVFGLDTRPVARHHE